MNELFLNTIVNADQELSQSEFLTKISTSHLEFQGVELREELLESDPARETTIKSLADSNQWTLYLSIPDDLFTNQGLSNRLEEVCQRAQRLGVRSLKWNLGLVEGIDQVDSVKLKNTLASYNVELTIENGQAPSNGSLETMEKALLWIEKNKLPIGFTFDLGNWTHVNQNAKEAFDHLKDKITRFHVKNVNSKGSPVLLDEGINNWLEFLGLDIPYILEYRMTDEELEKEYAKFKKANTKL